MMSSHSDSFIASGSSPTQREEIPSPPDFVLENHGSILLLRPQNQNAVAWLDEKIGSENGFQPYWPTAMIEPRYVAPILAGITNEALKVAEEK
jgi:hypothetical protein